MTQCICGKLIETAQERIKDYAQTIRTLRDTQIEVKEAKLYYQWLELIVEAFHSDKKALKELTNNHKAFCLDSYVEVYGM